MTTSFTVFNLSSGEILRTGYADELTATKQAQDGEGFLLEFVDGTKFYIDNYVVVAKPEKPFPYCIFDYTSKQWIDPRTTDSQLIIIRNQRDLLLSQSDWVIIKSVDTDTTVSEDWKVYRQALRDITLQPDVFNIIWPTAPQG